MIRIIRTMRKRLFSENKFSNYLLYAIGEIILVVIGILIALQINNWNEDAKLRATEHTFLNRLQIDLKDNITNWNTIIEREERFYEGAKAFIRLSLQKNKDSIMKIFPYVNPVGRWDDITMNQVTFKEMQSSGQLDLITNDSLKIKLMQLDHFYQKVFNRYESIKVGHFNNIGTPINEALDFKLYILFDDTRKDLQPDDFTDEDLQKYFESYQNGLRSLLKNQSFTNGLTGRIFSYELIIGELLDAKGQAQELIDLIEIELSAND